MTLSRLWHLLRRRGAGKQRKSRSSPGAGISSAMRRAVAGTRSGGRLAPAEFLTVLDQMEESDPGLRTRLHLLSLGELREAVGPKWPRLAEKVGWVADSIIRRHVGAADLFTQADAQTFVVAMPHRSRDDARRVIAAIAQELTSRILGEHTIAGSRPTAIVANMALDQARGQSGGFDAAMLSQVVAASRSLLPSQSVAQQAGGGDVPLVASLGRAVRVGQMMAEAAAGAAADGPAWQVFRNAPASRSESQAAPGLSPDARLALVWRPTWVADREAIAAYAARVIRIDSDEAPTLEGSLAYTPGDGRGAEILDRFVVAQAVRDLQLAPAMAQTSVIVPVSWHSLAAECRHDILRPFADLTEAARRQRLTVEVFDIPEDAASRHHAAIGTVLERVGCEVLVRQHLADALGDLAGRWRANLGLELAELRPEERVGDDELLLRIDRMRQQAATVGARCYLWGARRRRVIGGLVARGFRMVNGPGLMEDVGRPAQVVPAPRARLMSAG